LRNLFTLIESSRELIL